MTYPNRTQCWWSWTYKGKMPTTWPRNFGRWIERFFLWRYSFGKNWDLQWWWVWDTPWGRPCDHSTLPLKRTKSHFDSLPHQRITVTSWCQLVTLSSWPQCVTYHIIATTLNTADKNQRSQQDCRAKFLYLVSKIYTSAASCIAPTGQHTIATHITLQTTSWISHSRRGLNPRPRHCETLSS